MKNILKLIILGLMPGFLFGMEPRKNSNQNYGTAYALQCTLQDRTQCNPYFLGNLIHIKKRKKREVIKIQCLLSENSITSFANLPPEMQRAILCETFGIDEIPKGLRHLTFNQLYVTCDTLNKIKKSSLLDKQPEMTEEVYNGLINKIYKNDSELKENIEDMKLFFANGNHNVHVIYPFSLSSLWKALPTVAACTFGGLCIAGIIAYQNGNPFLSCLSTGAACGFLFGAAQEVPKIWANYEKGTIIINRSLLKPCITRESE